MNRVFYIFRHGETDWNRERRCQGHTNIALNERGLEQAALLAQKLLDVPLDIIVSSDLERALSTGKIVAEKKNLPLIIDPRFREMSYGEAEGMLFEKAVELYGSELWQNLQSFKKCNDQVGFPDGETRLMARERFQAGLIDIIEKTPYKTIGISTHGGAIRNILHSFLSEEHPLLQIPNCVVYKCEYDSLLKSFRVDHEPL